MQVALPQAEIYNRLTGLGWDAQIDLKNGIYIAKGSGPNDAPPIERVGQTPEGALAALLMYAVRSTQLRQFVTARTILGGWSQGFEDKLKEIGSAYSKLRVFDQKAVPAWRALATESGKQADAIRAQIKVEVTDSPEPYDSLREMVQDVHHDKKFLVSRAHANHPVWSKEDVVNFRIVHEVLGHVQSGGDFSWVGENMATSLHMPLVTPLAREALFVEVIGQAAYQNLYHGYGPQKIGFMSEFLHPVQGDEGEHVAVPHGGIPDLGGMAAVMNSEDAYGWTKTPQGDWKQVPDKGKQSEPKMSADVAPHVIGADPNADWETPPEFVTPAIGAGQEGDYIDQIGAFDNAAKIDTEWWKEDPARQDQAIMNALRVAILSPQKNLRWNAAHYQAIKDMPSNATAPDMWQRLEEERNSHNDKLGVPTLAHAQVSTQVAFLADELEKENPDLTRAQARRQAKQTFYDTIKSFEEQLFMDADEADELTPMRRHIEARKLAVEYLRDRYTPVKGWQPGQTVLAAEDTLFDPGQTEVTNDATGFAAPDAKYGAFQAAHLEGIEDASKHIDEIRAAALKDIHETGGLGHQFRHTLLNLNIRGISTKVASFAWLLLRPLTSDLGIIDTHMARGLGVQASGNSVPLRDYYKAERMQRAAKDASGYAHLPLGIYHWGLWDTVRSGAGSHSDHSTLRVLDPEPHNEQYWPPASNAKQEFVGPPEFERIRPSMNAVGHQFDKELGHLPQGEIPDIRKAILERPSQPSPNMHMLMTGAEFAPSPHGTIFKPGDRVMLRSNGGEYGTVISVEPPAQDYVPDECEMCGAATDNLVTDEGNCANCGSRPHEHDDTIWTRVKMDDGQTVRAADSALYLADPMALVPGQVPAQWMEQYQGPDNPQAIEGLVHNAKTATDDWGAFDEEPGEFANVNWQNMDWGDELGDEQRQKYWNNRQPWIFHDGVLYLGHESEFHGDLARHFPDLEDYVYNYRDLALGHKIGDEIYALNDKGKQVEQEVRRRIANGEFHQPGDNDYGDQLETYEDYPPPDHSGF